MNKLLLRKIHRWLGLIAGIQLLAWTVSGLYFTVIPIDEIRGDHILDIEAPEPARLDSAILISPSRLIEMHPDLAKASMSGIVVAAPLGIPVYLLGKDRFNATNGERMGFITASEAEQITRLRTTHKIHASELIKEVPIDHEYRNGELPAYRITLDNQEDAVIYVGATTGRIRAVRTNSWRIFDFLWSLHIMDYGEREDFNHWLIRALAILGLVTVCSGLTLFFATQRWRST